ncbi:uncharacterized protein J8A68_003765 [[Candida] subhashii]|uniref:Uncharacterized protein n=1 Tax=[Candida] subhashii TaxID=561895 RepID=A0A8J5QCW0_9ASCO|nr:uncharacterized protein J8A68_003765 [[Candida] subhashii]KAG7662706.1 hypothetical protein J8A68_003765 [[Candida] subhashii]
MKFSRRLRHKLAYWFLATLFALAIIQLLSYDDSSIFNRLMLFNYSTSKKNQIFKNQLIFPKNLEIEEDIKTFVSSNPQFFNKKLLNYPKFIQASEINETSSQIHSNYSPYNFTIFTSGNNIHMDLNQCDSKLKSTSNIQIDQAIPLDVSLPDILTNLLQEMESGTSQYLNELAPFVLPELRLQLKLNVVDRFWYRLAGSSVWLEQYGVHFMISRILYSPKGARNQPIISLTYAQIFDKDWNELINTKLLVPTNNLKKDKSKLKESEQPQKFKILNFPYFLPIPFWHDYDDTSGKYYGPEDPRLILVKNKRGYEEPLVVFNAYHRKLVDFDDDDDTRIVMKPDFYRSMFLCWPWQFQRGKENVEAIRNPDYDTHLYNRIVELQIKNLPRMKTQKNWTPFISQVDRIHDGYDKRIQFIYRWANLDVLKCDLDGKNAGVCGLSYRLNENLAPKNEIGPLRGGTQLININQLLQTANIPIKKFIVPNREIWVGFARAHLDDCGCGKVLYRPNMVIIVKDKIKMGKSGESLFGAKDNSKIIYRDLYKVSHISSSLSFDIPILGWDLLNPSDLCGHVNVLIPNGISSWTIQSLEKNKDTWKSDDYLTLSLSMSDATVHKINIKGLFQSIIDLPDKSLFLEPDYKPPSQQQSQISKEIKKKLQIPESAAIKAFQQQQQAQQKQGSEDDNEISLPGFNNDNVVCALQSSVQFCAAYGKEAALAKEQKKKTYGNVAFAHDHDDYDDLGEGDSNEFVGDFERERYFQILNYLENDFDMMKSDVRRKMKSMKWF